MENRLAQHAVLLFDRRKLVSVFVKIKTAFLSSEIFEKI